MQNSSLSQSLFVASIAALSFTGCSANGAQLPAAPPASATLARVNHPATTSTCPVGAPGWALNGNIISDGDFAGTTPSNYTINQYLTPTNWQVTAGDVDEEDGTEFPFPAGACSVDLDGHNPGAIAEVINTLPNRHYKVKFYFSGNGDGPPNVKKLVVTADGGQTRVYHWHLNSQGTARNGDYVVKRYTFQAGSGSTTTLQFASQDSYYSAYGPVVFQISARP
jgi:hypothetical protein